MDFDLRPLYNTRNGTFADITICSAVDGKAFEVHRFVLTAASPFFRGIISECGGKSMVALPEKGAVLDRVLGFMYGHKFEVLQAMSQMRVENDLEVFVGTFAAAEKYQVPGLQDYILQQSAEAIPSLPSEARLVIAAAVYKDDFRGQLMRTLVQSVAGPRDTKQPNSMGGLRPMNTLNSNSPAAKGTLARKPDTPRPNTTGDFCKGSLGQQPQQLQFAASKGDNVRSKPNGYSSYGDGFEESGHKRQKLSESTYKPGPASKPSVAIDLTADESQQSLNGNNEAANDIKVATPQVDGASPPKRPLKPSKKLQDSQSAASPLSLFESTSLTAPNSPPASHAPVRSPAKKDKSDGEKHCLCRTHAEDPTLLMCDQCDTWFHPGCIGKGQYPVKTYEQSKEWAQKRDLRYYRTRKFVCVMCEDE